MDQICKLLKLISFILLVLLRQKRVWETLLSFLVSIAKCCVLLSIVERNQSQFEIENKVRSIVADMLLNMDD